MQTKQSYRPDNSARKNPMIRLLVLNSIHLVWLLPLLLFLIARPANAAFLTFVEVHKDDVGDVDGLDMVQSVTTPPLAATTPENAPIVAPAPLPPSITKVAFGTEFTGSPDCEIIDPLPSPITYPAGTTQIAFQVVFDVTKFQTFSSSLDKGFGGPTISEYCNKYVDYQGQVRQSQLGVKIRRLDDLPLKPDTYTLSIFIDGSQEPTLEIPFEILPEGTLVYLPMIMKNWSPSPSPCNTPGTPSLISPSNGATINDTPPTFDWNAASNATGYQLQVDNDPDFSSPEIDITTASLDYTPSSPLGDDTYSWRVRGHNAGNECDVYGSWSSVWSVSIDTIPPSPPDLVSPSNGSTTSDTTPTFDWMASSDATQYQLQVDNNANFSSPEIDTTTASLDYTPSSPLSDDTYSWRIRASDVVGNWSNWSSVWSVTIATPLPTVAFNVTTYIISEDNGSAPIVVTLSGPSGQTVSVDYATSNGTAIAGSDYTATSGMLSFAPNQTSQTFSVPITNDLLDEPDETINLALSSPVNATLGTPVNATLTIVDDDPCNTPGIPSLVSPSDGTLTNDNTPTFDWNSANNATEYQLQVDNDANFSSPEINIITSTTAHTPTLGLSEFTYYWQVRGHNTSNGCDVYGSWSSIWSVSIDTTPPPVPTLVSPSNSSTTSDTTPTFEWTTSSGATQYQLQVDNNANFSSPAIDPTTAGSDYTPTSALNYNTYYWRVRARDAAGNWSGWSLPVWNFTIISCTPGTPSLVSPGNSTTTNDNTPTFDWNSANNATEYQLQVDNDANFSSPEINIITSTTAHTPTLGLSEFTYYWQVRGHNTSSGCDEYGSWSSIWSVTIESIWSGSTSQELPISFKKANNQITSLTVEFQKTNFPFTCTYTLNHFTATPITGNTFQVTGQAGSPTGASVIYTITGTFNSNNTSASGDLQMTVDDILCNGDVNATWTATRQ